MQTSNEFKLILVVRYENSQGINNYAVVAPTRSLGIPKGKPNEPTFTLANQTRTEEAAFISLSQTNVYIGLKTAKKTVHFIRRSWEPPVTHIHCTRAIVLIVKRSTRNDWQASWY